MANNADVIVSVMHDRTILLSSVPPNTRITKLSIATSSVIIEDGVIKVKHRTDVPKISIVV